MAYITYAHEFDERFKWYTHMVRVDGITIAGITGETSAVAVEKFVSLCREREAEITVAVKAAEEKRNWNYANPGKGKNWPEFGKLERLKDSLLKEAGIKDS